MKSLTSIPVYLWRNTLQRWIENPASPATKFLIPFLFGMLALFVFGLFRGIEAELKAELGRSELRMIRVNEHVGQSEAYHQYHSAIQDGSPWKQWCTQSDLLLQAPTAATTLYFTRVPVLGYIEEPSFMDIPESPAGDARPVLLLTSQRLSPSILEKGETIKLSGSLEIDAQIHDMPARLSEFYQTSAIALFPAEMLEPLLTRSHSRLQLLITKQDVTPRQLEDKIRRMALADDRNLRIFSAQSIMDKLVELTRRQEMARALMSIGIAAILSLILGSLSLLEFRQELYLFALLQSFGVRARYLLFHHLLETSLIAFAGALAALLAAKAILPRFTSLGDEGTRVPFSMDAIAAVDLFALAGAITLGILISALPLIPGLRKPAGLYLQ